MRKSSGVGSGRFLVVLPGILAQAMLSTSLTPGLPQMALAFGGGASGEFLASLALTSGSFGLMLAGFGSGWLFDRTPPRTFMVIFLALIAAAGSAGLLLDDPIAIIASRVIAGMAACALVTACMAFLNSQYSEDQRSMIIGYQTAFGSAAAILALLAAGQLVRFYGWHGSFAMYLIFIPALALVPITPRTGAAATVHAAADHIGRGPLSLWPIYLLAIILYMLVVVPGTEGPYLLQMNGIGSAGTIAATLSVAPFIAALVSLRYGVFDRWLGAAALLRISLFSSAIGLAILGTAHGIVAVAAGMSFYGFGIGFWTPYLVESVMRKNLGSGAFGILIATLSLGIFLNPLAFAGLNAIAGLRASLLLCAAGLSIGAVVSVVRSIGGER